MSIKSFTSALSILKSEASYLNNRALWLLILRRIGSFDTEKFDNYLWFEKKKIKYKIKKM